MRRLVFLLTCALTAVACSGDSSETTLPAELDVVRAAAATAMGEVDTVRFTLERAGAPVYIDDLDTIEFVSAEGRFAAPSTADAVVQVSVVGLSTQIGAVAVDGETWLTNPITGTFEPAPVGYDFDPATLFDPSVGLPVLLAEDLADAELRGLEERGEGSSYHVRGVAPAERVEVITARLVRNQDVTVDLWIDPTTGHLTEAAFATLHGGAESTWRLTFADYGADIEITPPDLDG
jgi:lipoprotein LprG